MGQFKITQMPLRVPKSLHRDLKTAAKHEGVSLNQLCLYLLSKNLELPKNWMSQKGEELLVFLQEALLFQKELKKERGPSAVVSPDETPLQRWNHLHAND